MIVGLAIKLSILVWYKTSCFKFEVYLIQRKVLNSFSNRFAQLHAKFVARRGVDCSNLIVKVAEPFQYKVTKPHIITKHEKKVRSLLVN